MVFLILAAQYERLTLPFAVILAVPFAVFGAFLAVWLRGLYNDLYLQIGLVTLVGLAAKNAILIVEFAAHMHREGGMDAQRSGGRSGAPALPADRHDVARVHPGRAAARALSTGAGAASRHSIGTGVIGGMLAATFIAVLFIPLFFVWTSRADIRQRVRLGRSAGARPGLTSASSSSPESLHAGADRMRRVGAAPRSAHPPGDRKPEETISWLHIPLGDPVVSFAPAVAPENPAA